MDNKLHNPLFDQGHFAAATGNVPIGWKIFSLDNESFPGIGNPPKAYLAESQVLKKEKDLPEYEWSKLVHAGSHVLKVFKGGAPVYCALEQHVQGLTAGIRYRFRVWVHPDIVAAYKGGKKVYPSDIWAAEARAGWSLSDAVWPRGQDQSGGAGVTWGQWFNVNNGLLKFGQYGKVWAEFTAPETGAVRVWLECKGKWGDNENNWFLDDATLYALEEEPEPGTRLYPRTYNLVPPDVTDGEWLEACRAARQFTETVGGSADDAMLDHPNVTERLVKAWWAHRWQGGVSGLEAFRDEYYPGARIEYVQTETEPEPEPPPEYGPLLGIHVQAIRAGLENYVRKTGAFQVVFGLGDVLTIKGWNPDTPVCFRYWVANQAPYLQVDDKLDSARRYIDNFRDGLLWTVNELEKRYPDQDELLLVASLNEENYDADAIIDFDAAFIRALAEVHPKLRAVVMKIPVGNPRKARYSVLADKLGPVMEEFGAYGGYHSYIACDPNEDYLESWWDYHAGRWARIDDAFRARGRRIRWALAEGGLVSTTDGGYTLNPGGGWRYSGCCGGNWGRYLGLLKQWEQLVIAEGKDVLGMAIFTHGEVDTTWRHFEIKQAQLDAMAETY